ncbi:MAG TPA: carboxylate--amine ligase [Roseiflexaceae bacterium]|nr:carboxylate--amine ligase [Roseiflexaceae bacterium]HMP39936.1 carboxylate--amine ligase [Roseiflexaceae bacterium]
MNVVFLSPDFPPNYVNFSIRLRQAGATVLGISDQPYDSLKPELRAALHEYYRVSDLHQYDELVRALGYFTHRYGKIDRLDSLNEYWIETEARLRTDFNIEGFRAADLPGIKRKSEMKRLFRRAGVNVVPGKVVRTPAQARNFVAEVGYPVVAKPDIGVGASKTYKITNPTELEDFVSRPLVDYFMEAFVEGTINTFDGLTDRSGNLVFYTSMQYSRGIMEIVNEDDDVFYYTQREVPADLEAAGRAIVRAFKVRERFFHFEFFRTPAGELVALEVNMRPPGGLSIDMFNFANDIDLYREWATVLTADRFAATYNWPYFICYVGRKSHKQYRLSHGELIERFGTKIVNHQPMPAVFHVAMGDYGYLLRSTDRDEVIAIAHEIQARA